jgi:23S rRNA (uridine2552-2'-O)-methyltransferase
MMSTERPGGGRLKSGKKRRASSRRWLERQLKDPYVAEAKRRGLRSRAAFKLIELDDRFRLLRPGARVVDLGAAPGGWTQVAVERTRAGRPGGGRVIALDLLEMAPIEGAKILRGDFLDEAAPALVHAALDGPADVVLSDMAPPSTGHPGADHLRIMALLEAALEFAGEALAPGGAFVCKVWQGGTEAGVLASMKQLFRGVRHAKPPSSRAESAEIYVVATGFRGR